MIYEIRNYFCDEIPTEEDILRAKSEALAKHCTVKLSWYGPAHVFYGDDTHTVFIKETDSVEKIMEKLPKIYAV